MATTLFYCKGFSVSSWLGSEWVCDGFLNDREKVMRQVVVNGCMQDPNG